MSKEVDKRVVQMQFDNRQFENGVKTTLGTLDKLKGSLNFENSAKSLEGLNSSVKKLDFNPLAAGVETVKNKFSALEVMAVTALANITNSVVNTGKQLVSSLTIEPIKQGFGEYELKMGSVQTIIASTGESLGVVNRYLEDLNTYADKTIYSFSDMTSSIGKFTNAGVGLDDSVNAIKGISNVAAVSGANSEQASHAMYNFAQALSSGSVKLIDWKSIENANMATVEFKQHLLDTALAMGTVRKEGDKYITTTTDANGEVSEAFDATSMFNDSLSHQWMTTDVLVKTLGEYADETTEIGKKAYAAAQDVKTFSQLMDTLKEAVGSGWTQTWEILFGDFEEAKKLWTGLSDTIGGMIDRTSKARNELLGGGLSSGWKQLMSEGVISTSAFEDELIKAAGEKGKQVEKLVEVTGSFEETLKTGWVTADMLKTSLNNMVDGIHSMTDAQKEEAGYTDENIKKMENLVAAVNDGRISVEEFAGKLKRPSGRENLIESVKNAFKGLMSVITPVNDAFREVFPPATAESLYDFTVRLRELTSKLTLSDEQTKNLKATFKGLFSVIKIVADVIKSLVGGALSLAKNFKGAGDTILKASAAVGEWFTNLHKSAEETNIFGKSVNAVVGFLQKAIDKIKEFFSIAKQKFDSIGFTTFLGVLKGIYSFAAKVGKVVLDVGKKIGGTLLNVFKTGGASELIDVLNGGLFGAFLVNINKLVNGVTGAFGGISDILENVTGILDGVKGALEAWQKSINAGTLKKIAVSIAILAGSLWLIASIDGEKLGNALAGLSVLFMELTFTMSKFSKMQTTMKSTGRLTSVMIGMSVSLIILAGACKKLSSLNWEDLAKGLVGVFALMEMITLACKQLDKIKGRAVKGAANIVIFAEAVKILASVCSDLAKLSWEELAKGLLGVGALIAEVDIFLNTAKFSGKAFAACLGMIELAAAIKILASAAGDFAKMEWGEIAKGLGAVGGLLLELGLFVNLTGNAKHVFSTGLSLITISAAMKILASAVSDFAKMNWSEIGRGLTAMAGALAEMVISLKLMPKNVLRIGTGLVVVGAALNIISAALGKMGGMSWGELAKGLAAMGGSMLTLALGLNGMKKAVKGAAALAITTAALALLVPELKILGSMDIKQIGIALLALAGSFAVLGVAAKLLSPLAGSMIKVAGAVSLFGIACTLAGTGILAVSVGLTALTASLVVVVSSLGEVISGVCYSIANSSKAISAAFVGLVEAACMALKGTIPLVADTLVTVLVQSLTSLKMFLPQIVDLVIDIAVQLMDKLSLRIPELVTSAVNMVGRFMDALDSALGAKKLKSLISSLKSVAIIFVAFAETAKIISELSVKDVLKGLPAFALAVAGFGIILAALGGISKIPGAAELIDSGAKIFAAMGKAIGAFIGCLITGIIENLPKDVSQTVTAMESVVAIVLALAPVVEALSNIEADIKNVLKGMASVGLVIAGIAGVLAALGGLAQIPGFNELISSGSAVLSGIGKALGGFVGSLIDGLAQAMTSDFEQIVKALVTVCSVMLSIGVLTKIIKGVDPVAAAKGIAAFDIVVAGLVALIAALGGITQIPGFDWIIGEGGETLCKIGSIIGQFVGSIISGLGVGLTSGLPDIGTNLSLFMLNATPFLMGAKTIDRSLMEGVKSLAEAILILTAADLVSGITSFITGGSSIADFGSEIAEFGPCLKQFSDSVSGINNQNVTAAANAAKALAEMAHEVPNEGGLAGWFAGENNVAKFGTDIASFGLSLKQFSDNIAGISPENVTAAANASKSLAQMASEVPNEGGLAGWFAGENNVAKFGTDIASFGLSLKQFGDNVAGIVPENVTAAANAGKALAEMASVIPNEGGVAAWFAGENSVSKFGAEIAGFGVHLKMFALNVAGIDPEAVTAAASAGKSLAEMASVVPKEGGVAAWFAGESSISKFGAEIAGFGVHLKGFSDNVADINPENVAAAAEAGKNLADMASTIPKEGGVAAWFTGESSIAKFGAEIADFGKHLKGFSDNVANINPENVAAAAEAGKNLAEMANVVPNEGGIKAWFTGESSLAKFGTDIAAFGTDLKLFGVNVAGINPENVTAAVNAGTALAELTQTVPKEGGIKAWFSGEQSLSKFGDQIADFGVYLQDFSDNVTDLNVPAVEAASQAGKAFAEMINCVPDEGLAFVFANSIAGVGESMKAFTETMDGVNADDAVAQVNKIVALAKKVKSTDMNGLESITNSLTRVSDDGITKFVNAFNNADTRLKKAVEDFVNKAVGYIKDLHGDFGTAGREGVSSLINGINEKAQAVISAFKGIINSAVSAITDKKSDIQNVGKQFSEGFAKGIRENTEPVKEASSDMGQAALDAARKTLDIHSPSKESYSLGEYTGMAFVNALNDYRDKSYKAGAEMASSAKDGLANAISSISKIIDGEVECDPTIRPVLDLSDVENGVGRIGNMFSAKCSIDLAARTSFNADTSIANRQNGSNRDIVDAVSALRGDVSSLKEVVGNLRVVMDSGALVGQITNGVDKALGKKARLAARR